MPDFVPLPECEGPRLQPYNAKHAPDIDFLEHIGQGVHAHVFKVKIDGKIFALKIVCQS